MLGLLHRCALICEVSLPVPSSARPPCIRPRQGRCVQPNSGAGACRLSTCSLTLCNRPAGDFGDSAVQGALVHQLRYLASVVTQNFSAFGELLALPKRFAEISGGWWGDAAGCGRQKGPRCCIADTCMTLDLPACPAFGFNLDL